MIEEDIAELTDRFEDNIKVLQDQVALLTIRLNQQNNLPGEWIKSERYPDYGPMYHFYTENEWSGISLWETKVKEGDSLKSRYQIRGKALCYTAVSSPILAAIFAYLPTTGLSVLTEP